MKKFTVQFVCMGNICRSPLAHAIFQKKIKTAGLNNFIIVESSGTGSWHVGELPDSRMVHLATKAGYKMDHPARHFSKSDLNYDLILAMDKSNLSDILSMADTKIDHIKLFRDFDPIPENGEVPDPYYGGINGFQNVLDIVERTTESLLVYIKKQLNI